MKSLNRHYEQIHKKMTTLYAVTAGQYEWYHVEAIFSTRELAQKYIEIHLLNKWDCPKIKEYQLDNLDKYKE